MVAARQALDDGAFHAFDGVVGERLQHADVLLGAGAETEPFLQGSTQRGERRGKRPVAVDRRVIERGRLAFQNSQEVQRIEHLLGAAVAPGVRRHDGPVAGHFDAIDVPLHGHGAEGPATRHAVAVAVEPSRLVLVHLGGLNHAIVEAMGRDRQRGGAIPLEASGHGRGVVTAPPLACRQTLPVEVAVQLVEVRDPRHRRRPLPLKILNAFLHPRLLGRRHRHAKSGRERVVAGQRGVAGMQRAIPTSEDVDRHGFGIVPPQFRGTQPKNAKASTSPCRMASVRSVGTASANGQFE